MALVPLMISTLYLIESAHLSFLSLSFHFSVRQQALDLDLVSVVATSTLCGYIKVASLSLSDCLLSFWMRLFLFLLFLFLV